VNSGPDRHKAPTLPPYHPLSLHVARPTPRCSLTGHYKWLGSFFNVHYGLGSQFLRDMLYCVLHFDLLCLKCQDFVTVFVTNLGRSMGIIYLDADFTYAVKASYESVLDIGHMNGNIYESDAYS